MTHIVVDIVNAIILVLLSNIKAQLGFIKAQLGFNRGQTSGVAFPQTRN